MTHEAPKANYYAMRYALVDVTIHKRNGKFAYTTQELTGEVFNTHDPAVEKVLLSNGCAE